MYFPAVAQALTQRVSQAEASGLRGKETILLVEDEEGVRSLASTSLQAQGYRVMVATDGEDALRVVQAHPGRIDLLLTDVVMPRMSGPALSEAIKARYPHAKLLFMSGYTDDAVVRHGLLDAEVSFIQKPYTPLGLARKVRQVLDDLPPSLTA
jgi:CheY-like chemotaxis protein